MNAQKRTTQAMVFLVGSLVMSMIFIGLGSLTAANNTGTELSQVTPDQVSGANLPIIGYATLQINGQAIDGETTHTQVGGVDVSSDFIEFFTYRHDMTVGGGNDGRARSTSQVAHSPIIITKRMDGTMPLFVQGLHQHQGVDGTFKFFDTDPDQGSTRERMDITISGGSVVGVRTLTILDQGLTHVIEEISFTYHTITFTDLVTSVEYTYTWDQIA